MESDTLNCPHFAYRIIELWWRDNRWKDMACSRQSSVEWTNDWIKEISYQAFHPTSRVFANQILNETPIAGPNCCPMQKLNLTRCWRSNSDPLKKPFQFYICQNAKIPIDVLLKTHKAQRYKCPSHKEKQATNPTQDTHVFQKKTWEQKEMYRIPSGELTFCHRKSPFFHGKIHYFYGHFPLLC